MTFPEGEYARQEHGGVWYLSGSRRGGRRVEALRVRGFRNTDISVLFPENVGSKDFAARFSHEPRVEIPRAIDEEPAIETVGEVVKR